MQTRLTLASRNRSHAGLLAMATVGIAAVVMASTARANETNVRVDVIAALVDDLPLDAADLDALVEALPGQATIGDVAGTLDGEPGGGLGGGALSQIASDAVRMIRARPGDRIAYVITAKVIDGDTEAGASALGGAVVTLHCDFGTGSAPTDLADGVTPQLDTYSQTGLRLPGKITDIGGLQDVHRTGVVESVASRQSAVLASGVLTVPLETLDGTYRIHVEPQIATVVDTTAAEPRHNRPDAMTSGPGFTVLVGQVETYSLRWGVASDGQGSATVEPALPAYPAGTVVTLTATPFKAVPCFLFRISCYG